MTGIIRTIQPNPTLPLQAPKVDSSKVLGLVSQALTAHGATCAIDAHLWRVTAQLSYAAFARLGRAGAAADSDNDNEEQETGAGGDGGSDSRALPAKGRASAGQLTVGGEGLPGVGARSAALPQPKRQRGTPSATSGALQGPPPTAPTTAAAGPAALSIRLTLFQQQRGQFELTASIPNASGLTEATRFTQLMAKVQADLTAMCA